MHKYGHYGQGYAFVQRRPMRLWHKSGIRFMKKSGQIRSSKISGEYKVISNKLVGGKPQIHVYSELPLNSGFTKAEETLEDVFFAKLNAFNLNQ